jgi:hypothetical protein
MTDFQEIKISHGIGDVLTNLFIEFIAFKIFLALSLITITLIVVLESKKKSTTITKK